MRVKRSTAITRARAGTADAPAARVLLPFGDAFSETAEPETSPAPEVVAIESLSHDAIEAAESGLEAEENKWPATA